MPTRQGADPFAHGPSQSELVGLLAGGAAVTATSYALGIVLARQQPHSQLAVDTLPIVGPMVAAARNPSDDRNASLLSFLAGAQAMGILVMAAAASDLAEQRRLMIDFSAGPNGCGASVTMRLP